MHIFYGTNTSVSLAACRSEAARIAGEGGEVVVIEADEQEMPTLHALARQQNLFMDRRVIIFKRALARHGDEIAQAFAAPSNEVLLWEDGAIDTRAYPNTFSRIGKNEAHCYDVVNISNNERDTRNAIFAFADAWGVANINDTLRRFHILLHEGTAPTELFWALVWQIRTALRVAALEPAITANTIARQTKLHPFVVQKSLRMIKTRPRRTLHHALLRLQDIEVKTKTASWEMESALLYFLLTS